MSDTCCQIYPIGNLPHVIPLGYRTEKGVTEIGFNVKPWLDAYEGIELSVWPTRPGESAAYPAADTALVGTVLYWYPNDADTAIAGEGKVEIVGLTADKRKLSGACGTIVRETSLSAEQEPPEGIKPYYEGILQAAEGVKTAVDAGDGGLYIVTAKKPEGGVGQYADRTQEEIRAAAAAGKTCVLADADGRVYTYFGEVWNSNAEGEVPTFVAPAEYRVGTGIVYWRAQVLSDGQTSRSGYNPARTPNPYKLTLTGAVDAKYDGSEAVEVELPESIGKLLIVTNDGGTASHTSAEIFAAVAEGKACLYASGTELMTYIGQQDGKAAFASVHQPTGGVNANAMGLWERNVLVDADGAIEILASTPAQTPNPWPLNIKVGNETTTYNGSAEVTVEVGAGGSLPSASAPHMHLVSDKDGNTVWEERTHYKETATAFVDFLSETTLTDMGEDEGMRMYALLTPFENMPVVGGMHTVVYNGTAYECPGVEFVEDGMTSVMLGNTAQMGVEGGNADAPFMLLVVPLDMVENMGGVYAVVYAFDMAESVTMSISGELTTTTYKTLEEGYLPESVRNQGKQITLTIDADGNVTSDTSFETAWAMTSAELQNAITIKYAATSYKGECYGSVNRVVKVKGAMGGLLEDYIAIYYASNTWVDTSDIGDTDTTREMGWKAAGVYTNASTYHPSLPWCSDGGVTPSAGHYLRFNGAYWTYATIDAVKADLGITDGFVYVVNMTQGDQLEDISAYELFGAVRGYNVTMDKSFTDVISAINAGMCVQCRLTLDSNSEVYNLTTFGTSSMGFMYQLCNLWTMVMWQADGTAIMLTND